MSSLKKEVFHGTVWASVEIIGQTGIMLIISIILARLLEPSDFGLIAMISIFISSATVVAEGGFVSVLTQRLNVTESDKCTVFWYNLFIGTITVILLWKFAPYIADFYNQPRLVVIIRWSMWGFFINCFGIVQQAMLQKMLRFRERAVVTIISIFLSGIVSVSLAIRGYGVWALVAQTLTVALLQVIGLWIIFPWHPRLVFNIKAFARMFSFGHNLMFSMIIRIIFENIYNVIIGKNYSPADLGFYYRSKRFSILASQIPVTATSRVAFPTFSIIQKDLVRLVQAYNNFLSVTMLIVVPLLAGMAVTAQNFICVFIGSKWLPSTPYLQILCLSGVFFPVHVLSSSVLNALGKARTSLMTEIIKYILVTLSILGLYRFGIIALLLGEAVAMFFAATVSFYFVTRALNITMIEPIKWLWPIFFSSFLMVLGVAFTLPDDLSLFALVLKSVIGVFIYLSGLLILRYKLVLIGIKMTRDKINKVLQTE